MIIKKFGSFLILFVFAFLVLIYAETNGNNNNNNNINQLNGQLNGNNNNNNMDEENIVAECTRCSESRLVGCMRGKCYYRCYRRCTLGNLTYVEALKFTLPGY